MDALKSQIIVLQTKFTDVAKLSFSPLFLSVQISVLLAREEAGDLIIDMPNRLK